MQYKITRQYSKDEENPLAEFRYLNDAKLFVDKKSSTDEKQNIKLIYRIFDNNKLLAEFNREKINDLIKRGVYAQYDKDLPISFLNAFKVIIKPYVENKQGPLAEFNNISDAKVFIIAKLVLDASMNVNTAYGIFNHKIFIEELSQNTINIIQKQNQESQGKPRVVSFRPSPFSTIPQPPGSPPRWIIDEDTDKDKKE